MSILTFYVVLNFIHSLLAAAVLDDITINLSFGLFSLF